jgi:hypothetical protein
MAFSFEPFLAISAGHIIAVSAGPEQYVAVLLQAGLCTANSSSGEDGQIVYGQLKLHNAKSPANTICDNR